MFKRLSRFFHAPKKKALLRFNAASQSVDSIRAFAGSDFLSADAAMTRTVRRTIAARARNEFANNSYAYGIVSTLADDTIGTGPRLQLDIFADTVTPDASERLQHREHRWREWSAAVNLNALLRRARIAKAVDGETFIVLHTNRNADRPVRLEPRLYEAEFVASENYLESPQDFHDNGIPHEVDGITYDEYGNPVSYRFWRVHPGANNAIDPWKGHIEPAKAVIHYGNFYRAGQHRGVSEMVAALNIFNDLRRYSTAVVSAAEVAARLSFIISNNLPAEIEGYQNALEDAAAAAAASDEPAAVTTALDLNGGPGSFISGDFNSLILPSGYSASQLKSEQPTQTYVTFKDAKIAEAARCFSMPFNIASGNSSSYNYASGRLDHQVYHKKLLIERDIIERTILDRLFAAWQDADRALNPADYTMTAPVTHSFMWDGFEHVDPVKEANAQTIRLANGVTTLAEECARDGRDYVNILRQRKRELDECTRLGLPLPAWAAAASAQSTEQEDTE